MEWIFLIAAGLLEVTWDCRIAAARKELNTTGRFLFFDVYTLPSSDASRHNDFSEKHDTSPVAWSIAFLEKPYERLAVPERMSSTSASVSGFSEENIEGGSLRFLAGCPRRTGKDA